jgi:hypothetical protein
MSQQAQEFHSIAPEKISLIGVPQFQHMLRLAERGIDRTVIDSRLAEKNFVVYCASATRVFPDEELFVGELIQTCKKLGLHLLVRMHPNERVEIYQQSFAHDPSIVLSAASSFFSAGVPRKKLEGDPNVEFQNFTFFMSRALAVVNLASTTSLDAMVFSTPVICPTFNIDPRMSGAWNEAKRWYESEHFAPVVKSGAIDLVESMQQLERLLVSLTAQPHPRRNEAIQFMSAFSPRRLPSQVIADILRANK